MDDLHQFLNQASQVSLLLRSNLLSFRWNDIFHDHDHDCDKDNNKKNNNCNVNDRLVLLSQLVTNKSATVDTMMIEVEPAVTKVIRQPLCNELLLNNADRYHFSKKCYVMCWYGI